MSAIKYSVGDFVWRATFDSFENYVTCPDCGGTGRLLVTFHDGEQVSIECQNCRVGFDPPTGHVRVHDRRPRAVLAKIIGFEVEGKKVSYKLSDCYSVAEDALFSEETGALAAAQTLAADADAEERRRILTKEKDTRSWAWNAMYHRREIKEAQRRIAYHSAKLAVASLKAKEKSS